MAKVSYLLVLSIGLALAVNTLWPGGSYQEQLIRLQTKKRLGGLIESLDSEPIEIQSVLLDYAANRVLVLKAQLALMKYPEKTRRILEAYGADPVFREILLEYGETVVPVIDYFLTSGIKYSVKFMHDAGQAASALHDWWNGADWNSGWQKALGPEQQGRYAILLIRNDGHDFLGQFVMDETGTVRWIQTERVTEGLTAFFSSGIRELETRYVTDQEVSANDLLWAGVDVLAVAGTLKLLRAGRQAARSGKSLGVVRQTAVFGSRLLKGGMAARLLKYSSVAATVWIIISHPSLITSLFAEAGRLAGISPTLVQMVGVSLSAFLVLCVMSWLFKRLVRPAIRFLNAVMG